MRGWWEEGMSGRTKNALDNPSGIYVRPWGEVDSQERYLDRL